MQLSRKTVYSTVADRTVAKTVYSTVVDATVAKTVYSPAETVQNPMALMGHGNLSTISLVLIYKIRVQGQS